MSFSRAPEERNAWIMLILAAIGYPTYVVLLLTGLGDPAASSEALVDRNFVPPMLDADRFWIANAIFLCFFLSALLSSLAKIVAYRGRFSASW